MNFSTRLARVLLALGLASPWSCAFAQSAAECNAVLSYTGREQSVVMSHELFTEWASSSSHNAKGWKAGGTYDGIGGSAASNESSDQNNANYAQWRQDFFKAVDKVFAPAVDAWLACMNTAAVRIQPTLASGSQLVVDLQGRQGVQVALKRLEPPPGVTCIADGQPLPADGVQISGNVVSVRCDRRDTSMDAKQIGFYLSTGSFILTLPEILPPPLIWTAGAPSVQLAAFGPCDQYARLSAEHRDRRLHVVLSMRGEGPGTSGVASVTVNGTVVARATGHDPSKNNSWGTGDFVGDIDIPADIPVIVHATGAVSGLSCLSLAGGVFSAQP